MTGDLNPAMLGVGLLVIIALLFFFLPRGKRNGVSAFVHGLPRRRYKDVVAEFGQPLFAVNAPGGVALWRPAPPYVEVVLKDESIQHKDHCDFLYATIQYYIPPEARAAVLSLSESINYDQLAQQLVARCHFMAANVATLWLATALAEGRVTLEQARENYKPLIMKAAKDTGLYKSLTEELGAATQRNALQYANMAPNFNCQIEA